MNTVKLKVTKLYNLVRALFPSEVPIGVTAFNEWADSIIDLYNFPNNDSVRFALATMIMHSGPTDAYVSKFKFALKLKAGAAKQVAASVFQELKVKQAQEESARQEALKSEVTVTAETTSDVPASS